MAREVITGQQGKDPDLARYVAERVVLLTKGVRQGIQVAKLCDSPEEWTGLRVGCRGQGKRRGNAGDL